MKNVLLVRHAKSSWSNQGLDDKDRPLNKRGQRDGPFMAAHSRHLGFRIDSILSSPANRALTTAKFFKSEYQAETDDISIESDLYFGSESDWLHLINELPEDTKFPAFFSHNPTITIMANMFAKSILDNVPTCGVIHLQSAASTWQEFDTNNTVMANYYFPKLVRKG